ncbi:MAG TPA: metalloregulator ArsR/SmtB family transcription factor [Sporichthyaceae bacterium]|nr:metalloregulator ArsR/SmtB family transcription factor [Sporichthyaceae bacterium]
MESTDLALLFKTLADPTRVQIVRLLLAGEVSCVAFDEVLPVSKSTVSYHLAALRSAGLINARKDGKFHHYNLDRKRLDEVLPGLLSTLDPLMLPPKLAGDPAQIAPAPAPTSTGRRRRQ